MLLLAALSVTAERSLDAGATQTASDVADLIAAGRLPQPVPVAGLQLVQVIDAQERVRAGSPGVDRLVPLLEPAELRRALAGRRFEIDGGRAGLNQPLRVQAVSAGPAGDRLSVVVAAPLGDDQDTLRVLRLALLALFLPLVFGLTAIAWWVIGRTLRPVEALRAGAEEITGQADGGGRLPVPGGADEIHRLALTLNGMLDRLETARRSQRRFVADAAHELRNPLAGMRTHLEVAQRHPDRVDWQELTDDLLTDTGRLAALADGLLLLAAVDEAAGPARRSTELVPVAETLTRITARYREARVAVQTEARQTEARQTEAEPTDVVPTEKAHSADELVVRVNADDLHRVLTNLVDNAVRHARSQVRLGAGVAGDQVWFSVSDDGPGIPEADRERVFERFVRLDDARATEDGGAGLGLAIVAELVRRNNGRTTLADAAPGLRVEVSFAGPDSGRAGPR